MEPNTNKKVNMNDKEFLQWIHQRLQYKYGENPKVDFMTRLESIVTAECLKNEAVTEGLEREANRKKIYDMRNKIIEIEKQIEEMRPHTTESLMLKTFCKFQNDVYDEIQKKST
ncbi:MAG: hypothetical protein GY810_00670 [Aureispira sp.]|nr:hypothetical protein [Aureispira sp.]